MELLDPWAMKIGIQCLFWTRIYGLRLFVGQSCSSSRYLRFDNNGWLLHVKPSWGLTCPMLIPSPCVALLSPKPIEEKILIPLLICWLLFKRGPSAFSWAKINCLCRMPSYTLLWLWGLGPKYMKFLLLVFSFFSL